MREQVAAFAIQRQLQIEHFKQLQESFEAAKAAFLGQTAIQSRPELADPPQTQQALVVRVGTPNSNRPKRDRSYRLRVSLPRWFVHCVWELGAHEEDGVWKTVFWPVNLRPKSAVAFDYVKSGNVEAVRKLLQSRHLSIRDHMYHWGRNMSLFDVSLTRKMAQMAKQAYYLQLAVDGGHLELCRFLLQNCTLFNHSNILDGARRSLFQHAALATCDPSVPRFIEEVIDLLATEDDGDVSTGLEYLAALGLYESFRLHQPLLAVIEIPNAEIPLAQRFELAIMSYDWHPDFFTAVFRFDEWAMVAKRANGAGKTALHWAAATYGCWSTTSGCQIREDDNYLCGPASGIAISSKDLIIKLIRNGADVHACWSDHSPRGHSNRSPFSALLDGLSPTCHWDAASLSDAVYRWGQILIEAGQSITIYAVMENEFLRANPGSLYMFDEYQFSVVALEVLAENRLTVRVEHAFEVIVWKAQPTYMPGAWPSPPRSKDPIKLLSELPDTIIWRPQDSDEQEGFHWVLTEAVSIKAHPYLLEPPSATGSFALDYVNPEKPQRPWEYYPASQDDHNLSVIVMMNDDEFRQKSQTYTRRRSASVPTINTKLQIGRSMEHLPGPWGGTIHQCASDMRWGLSRMGWFGLRDCMLGRCRERTNSYGKCVERPWDNWEYLLLKDEDHAQAAKRFAERFCPQYLDKVETTLARVTERAQLAMGPARPPARSW
jgi:hypothetical protein